MTKIAIKVGVVAVASLLLLHPETAHGALLRWASPVNISNMVGHSSYMDIAADSAGTLHVVWADNAPGQYDIFYSAKRAGGSWSPPVNITSTATNSLSGGYPPSIAVDGSRTLHVVWWEGDTLDETRVLYAFKRPGEAWSTPAVWFDAWAGYIEHDLGLEELAWTVSSGGTVHILWTKSIYDTGLGDYFPTLFYTTWSGGLVSESDAVIIERSEKLFGGEIFPDGSPMTLRITVDGAGVAHLVWRYHDYCGTDCDEIFYATPGSALVNISNNQLCSEQPWIAVDGGGTVHTVWIDTKLRPDPYQDEWYMRYSSRPPGGSWSTPVTLNAVKGSFPRLAVDTEGTLHLFSALFSDYARKPPGGSWSAINFGIPGWYGDYQIAVDPDGMPHVVWHGAGAPTAGGGDDIAYSTLVTNNLPTAPEVDVTPDSPVTTDRLHCHILTLSTDADGDRIMGYRFDWYKDGILQSGLSGLDRDAISASDTTKGEVWRCVVIPNDGLEDGLSAYDEVTIQNSPPTVASVPITPDPAYTNSDLTGAPSGWSDPDNDPEGYQWQWQKLNGLWEDIPGANTDTLDHSNFVKGDQIKVICTPYDGTDTGTPVEDTITISSSPPTALPGDINRDGIVDYLDLGILGAAYGTSEGEVGWNPAADLNNDGVVDYRDLAILGANYGREE